MKSSSPSLLPLLRSRAQGDIIAWILLHPEQEFSLVEIARHVGVSSATVMREVDRLLAAGYVTESRRGNSRLVRADSDNPAVRPLAELIAVTFGPVPVLREMLSNLDGVEEAFIYGSYADRYAGNAGQVPKDIDVLVIGTTDSDVLFEVSEKVSRLVGREVNIRKVRPNNWNDKSKVDSFRDTVMSRPKIALVECKRAVS